jgi:hypothetical protein
MIRNKKEQGFTIALAMIVAIVLGVLVLAMANTMQTNARQQVYFNSMNHTYRAAESGLNKTIGQLSVNPSIYLTDPQFSNLQKGPEGEYQVSVDRRDLPNAKNIYYITTTATQEIGGKKYSAKLHSYVQISNVSDYFAAINGECIISHPTNIGQGKVYGLKLTFDYDRNPATKTFVQRAEFVKSDDPVADPHLRPALPWDGTMRDDIQISDPADNLPVQLDYPLLFPQLLNSDILHYATVAHADMSDQTVGHQKCQFSGDIFPPGYWTADGAAMSGDLYPKHTASNGDHVYFCNGNITQLEGVVHGQVLFVAMGDIHITGNLQSASLDDSVALPGAGSASVNIGSSTAHQAVLMTCGENKNIYIDPSFLASAPATPQTQIVQGLFMAPHGTITPQPYDPNWETKLNLAFTGSLILRSTPPFSNVFQGTRSYAYMTSLKTNPPPDLPALAEIYYSIEETIGLIGN